MKMTRWLLNTYIVFRIELQNVVQGWKEYLISVLISSATFFMLRLVVNPDPEVEIQLLAGAIVFGVGMISVSRTGQLMVSERFEGRMKLFITSPISQSSYMVGVTTMATVSASITAVVVLALAAAAGVQYHLSPLLIPLIIFTGLTLTGIAVIIATHARTALTAYMLCDAIGVIVVFCSPIFYPVERLPEWLQWVARISPFTHAGQAFREVLSGGSSILVPVCVLLGFMALTNTLGITRMRWREP